MKRACEAARKSGNTTLLVQMLFESNDWKELAKLKGPLLPVIEDEGERSFVATFNRLGGDSEIFKKRMVEVMEKYGKPGSRRSGGIKPFFFLNDRFDDGLSYLRRAGHHMSLIPLLAAQMRFNEALQLAENEIAGGDPKWVTYYRLCKAEMLTKLGEKEKATEVLGALEAGARKRIRDNKKARPMLELANWMASHGMQKQAIPLYVEAVPHISDHSLGGYFIFTFSALPREIGKWLEFFRTTDRNESKAGAFVRAWRMVAGEETVDEVATAVRAAAKKAPALERKERVKWLSVLGETCLRRADAYWGICLPQPPAGQGQEHLEPEQKTALLNLAADILLNAWKQEPAESKCLFLYGRALSQNGFEEEGRQAMNQARLITLDIDGSRSDLACVLWNLDDEERTAQDFDILSRTVKPGFRDAGDILCAAAVCAEEKGNYFDAAALMERYMFQYLNAYCSLEDTTDNLALPHFRHRMRALGYLARGETGTALEEADLCLKALPGDVGPADRLIPELEKRGLHKEADKLFARIHEYLEERCRRFPKSAVIHGRIARLLASCGRTLDEALEHAECAVALDEREPAYLATLAEVQSLRGEKKKAAETMRRYLKIAPYNRRSGKLTKRIGGLGFSGG